MPKLVEDPKVLINNILEFVYLKYIRGFNDNILQRLNRVILSIQNMVIISMCFIKKYCMMDHEKIIS